MYKFPLVFLNFARFWKIHHNYYAIPLDLNFWSVRTLCVYFLTSLVPFNFDECSSSYYDFISAYPIVGQNCTPKSPESNKNWNMSRCLPNLCRFKAYWSNFYIQKVSLRLTKESSSCELTNWISLGCLVSVPTE